MIIFADDLSGAQECIATAAKLPVGGFDESATAAATILLDRDRPFPNLETFAVDTNTRSLNSDDAAQKTRQAVSLLNMSNLRHLKNGHQIYFKFDSLLRGNIGSQLEAVTEELGTVVFCPSVPMLNRVVQSGMVTINGIPLHETGLWHLESERAPKSVSELFQGLTSSCLSLDQVRSGELSPLLRQTAYANSVILCDAETDEDLDAIAAAVQECGLSAAGAGGLCAALSRIQPPARPLPIDVPLNTDSLKTNFPRTDSLFVVGTASEQARKQVEYSKQSGLPIVSWQPGNHIDLPDGDCVLTLSGPIRPDSSRIADQGLADLVARDHKGRDLFLTGGQTARSVLDALGISELRPIAQPELGTVISCTPDGRLIVTRPGSFGSIDNLIQTFRILKHLRVLNAPNERTSS